MLFRSSLLTLVPLDVRDRLAADLGLTLIGSLLVSLLVSVLTLVPLDVRDRLATDLGLTLIGSLLVSLLVSVLTLVPLDVRDRLAADLGLTLIGSLLVSLLVSFLTLVPLDVRDRLAADLGRLSLSASTLSNGERDRAVLDLSSSFFGIDFAAVCLCPRLCSLSAFASFSSNSFLTASATRLRSSSCCLASNRKLACVNAICLSASSV